ncbi:MAG: T9SS type A sorting domain-containing protein [Edaphocola sp.]
MTNPILFLFLSLATAQAQPGWQWGKQGGNDGSPWGTSSNGERVVNMATDPAGNVYVLATNNKGIGNVDGHMGVSYYDYYSLSSFSCNGTFRWAKFFGSSSVVSMRALGVDSIGGVYIAGYISSQAGAFQLGYLDTDTIIPPTNKRMFLAKYDTSGQLKWLRMPQPDTASVGGVSGISLISVSAGGNVYALCSLSAGNYSGSGYIVGSGDPVFHVLQYDKDGNFVKGHPLDITVSTNATYGNPETYNVGTACFARDHKSGRYYIAGEYDSYFGTLSFGNTPIIATDTGVGILPIFVAAFDSLGNNLWARQSLPSRYLGLAAREGPPIPDVYSACGIVVGYKQLGSNGTGISSTANFAEVRIYPNPTIQSLHISNTVPGTQLDLYNATGSHLLSQQLSGNDEINVQHLAAGVYLLRFTTTDGRQGSRLFVKE